MKKCFRFFFFRSLCVCWRARPKICKYFCVNNKCVSISLSFSFTYVDVVVAVVSRNVNRSLFMLIKLLLWDTKKEIFRSISAFIDTIIFVWEKETTMLEELSHVLFRARGMNFLFDFFNKRCRMTSLKTQQISAWL